MPANDTGQANAPRPPGGHFIVCGYGKLGRQCVAALMGLDADIRIINDTAIDLSTLTTDGANVRLVLGDCRHADVLSEADVAHCRAILLVVSELQCNVTTALAVRQINPQARIILRSAQENLNQLFAARLGNLLAFDPSVLAAPAFAWAALGTGTLGQFLYAQQWFRLVERRVVPAPSSQHGQDTAQALREGDVLSRLETRVRRVLRHLPAAAPAPTHTFYDWQPDALLAEGDRVLLLECIAPPTRTRLTQADGWKTWWNKTAESARALLGRERHQHILRSYMLVAITLLALGTTLFHFALPESNLLHDFLAATVLMLGGYGDIFGFFKTDVDFPAWMQVLGLLISLSGIVLVGMLFGLLTETLLAARFALPGRRSPIPEGGHNVVVGLGRVGQSISTLLHNLGQPVVAAIPEEHAEDEILPGIATVHGSKLASVLQRAHVGMAHSVILATDNELLNLEAALMTHALNPSCRLVIRSDEQRLAEHLADLLPRAESIMPYQVAADAFVAGALGEQVHALFRLGRRTILLAEFQVTAGDSLTGLRIGEVIYGFAVVAVALTPAPSNDPQAASSIMLPDIDYRLAAGDRLLLLSTMDGLRRIENNQRALLPDSWTLDIPPLLMSAQRFEAANVLARFAGLSLAEARERLSEPSTIWRLTLYRYQAERLQQELGKRNIHARLLPEIERHAQP